MGYRDLIMPAFIVLCGFAWVGHACFWTYWLNHLYGRPLSKRFLKPWRLITGVVILAAPLILASAFRFDFVRADWELVNGIWGRVVLGYAAVVCLPLGLVVFPIVTLLRVTRRTPPSVLAESTRTNDFRIELGDKAVGDGKWQALTRLPGNSCFRVDFTELTLAPPRLPPAWDGLTILLLSDLHFHGTPSRAFFQCIFDEIARQPTPDIIALAGDFVDTDTHHEWIAPLLGQLKWKEHGLAILGNHDDHHQPQRVREELQKLGYAVLPQQPIEMLVRGERCLVVGHEGPWFPPPTMTAEPAGEAFRLCVSHTPDNFYWGQRHAIDLMLCGHVHGGQIRLPVVGSIFVPSVHSRRFDMGVFEQNGTLMVVGRGLSGKEPLRFRCNPQVIRITLKSPEKGEA